MKKLATWIEDYVENGKSPSSSGDKGFCKDAHTDFLRKRQFKRDLLDKGEALLEQRRKKLYLRQLSELKAFSNPKLDY